MKPLISSKPSQAFTVVELLVITGMVALLAVLLLPTGIHGDKLPASRLGCANNLKQIGLAFNMWAIDHGGKYPAAMGTNSGGSLEYIPGGETFRHFQVVSNVFTSPKSLICPADIRKRATNFGVGLSNTNVSYFVGVDAAQIHPEMFLSGDRNLTNGATSASRMLELHTNSVAGWTRQIHVRQGNIGLADGSVQYLSNYRLKEALRWGGTTNRLAMP